MQNNLISNKKIKKEPVFVDYYGREYFKTETINKFLVNLSKKIEKGKYPPIYGTRDLLLINIRNQSIFITDIKESYFLERKKKGFIICSDLIEVTNINILKPGTFERMVNVMNGDPVL